MSQEYEFESRASRDDTARVLRAMADGVTAGSIRLGEEGEALDVEIPEEVLLDIEFETEDDTVSLEVELEWPQADREGDESAATIADDARAGDDDEPAPIGAADSVETLARFELFRDRGDEWRWRLVHRNGNIIATSGEGYTQKHNARKGLRSVVQNAPEAAITDDPEE